jgi:transketolase
MDAVQQAKSGHPGAPMGMADIATVLFKDFMQFDAADPHWFDRDRFVLSNGHGSMLLYSLLYLTGYKDMTLDEIKRFRQIDSKTAGHPEYKHADGIETTTGPLGQGIANSVGIALAERIMNAKFGDDLVKHWTYVFMGDGCLMEGISQEAISLAGPLQARPPDRLLGQQLDHDRRRDQPVRSPTTRSSASAPPAGMSRRSTATTPMRSATPSPPPAR